MLNANTECCSLLPVAFIQSSVFTPLTDPFDDSPVEPAAVVVIAAMSDKAEVSATARYREVDGRRVCVLVVHTDRHQGIIVSGDHPRGYADRRQKLRRAGLDVVVAGLTARIDNTSGATQFCLPVFTSKPKTPSPVL